MFLNVYRSLFLLLLSSVAASADSLTFSLDDNGVAYSPPGGYFSPDCTNADGSFTCVVFTGTITTGGDESQDYSLNQLNISMNTSNPDAGLVVADNTPTNIYYIPSLGNNYFLNATAEAGAGVLGPDDTGLTPYSYSGGVFEIDVPAFASPGQYFGTATLDYSDANGPDCTVGCSVSANFEVVVAPEPGPFALVAGGVALIGLLRCRSR